MRTSKSNVKKKSISVISRGEVEQMCEGCFSLFTDDRVRFGIVSRSAKPYD